LEQVQQQFEIHSRPPLFWNLPESNTAGLNTNQTKPSQALRIKRQSCPATDQTDMAQTHEEKRRTKTSKTTSIMTRKIHGLPRPYQTDPVTQSVEKD